MTETTTRPAESPPAPPASADPERRRPIRAWLTDRSKLEVAVWVGLIAVAFGLRMYDLGSRPFHHDESQDAYFSWVFRDTGDYSYNPLLHGPLRFYLTGLSYLIFGDSDVTARLAPAVMGTLAVGLPYLLRHQLGRVAAFSAAVILAFGPTYLYFSRFAREDIYLAAITLAIFVTAFRFLRRPRALTLSLLGALFAVAYATKESGIVMVGFFGIFFLGAIAVQGVVSRRRGGRFADGEVLRALLTVGWPAWTYAIATLVLVYALLFTVFFTQMDCTTAAFAGNPARETSCINSVFFGLEYWMGQQDVARGDDKAWLYLAIVFGEEWPALLLAAVGVVFAFLRPTTLRLFLVWMLVATSAFYSWGSERFAWLVLHPLLPLILLAGLGVQCLWGLRSRVARTAAMVAVAIGAVYMVGASFSANAKQAADPRSLLVSTQSSVQVKEVADQVRTLIRGAREAGQPPLTITVDSGQGATFPYAWYFRHDQVGYIDMTTAGYVPNTQVLVMTDEGREALRPNLSAYAGRRFDFRVWWIKDYEKKFSTRAWWDWFTVRKPWNETGGMKEWLYVRRDAGPLPGKGTRSLIPPPPS